MERQIARCHIRAMARDGWPYGLLAQHVRIRADTVNLPQARQARDIAGSGRH